MECEEGEPPTSSYSDNIMNSFYDIFPNARPITTPHVTDDQEKKEPEEEPEEEEKEKKEKEQEE